jgi:hypothetical protein
MFYSQYHSKHAIFLNYILGRFIPDEYFCLQRRLWIRVLLYVKTPCIFYFQGEIFFRFCAAGKSVKNYTFYWFLARRTSTVGMKITAFWEMKDDGII